MSKAQQAIDKVVSYLQENNQRAYATAVQNAAGRVLTYENGEMRVGNYNKRINRWLTESLFFMNSDPMCPPSVIKITRKLIESYRDMNGMSTSDFTTDMGDAIVEVNPESSFDDEVTDIATLDQAADESSATDYIIDNTEVGQEYALNDIIDFFSSTQDADAMSRISAEDEVLSALKSLVSLGYFEVTSRDDFNGRIQDVIRVR